MAANTTISWAKHTMNFWVGCAEVGPACDDCYAKAWALRAGRSELWQGVRNRTKTWRDPYKFNKAALASGVRDSVFANSLADFFDNHPDIGPWRDEAWNVIAENDALIWYLVTKRIPNVEKMLPTYPAKGGFGWSQENFGHVVIIATVVTQAEWNRDGPRLKALKASFPWLRVGLSMEPLLDLVDLGNCSWLDWVIVGGESGGKARPMKPAWARSLRDQCLAAGVPFHFKQWGEFHFDGQAWADGLFGMAETPGEEPVGTRVGVKKTGRLLDSRTHDDGPRQVAG